MMKTLLIKFLSLSFLLSFFCNSYGQFAINGPKAMNVFENCFTDKLEDSDYKKLKKATTYFVLPQNLLDEKESIQKLFSEAWSYNEIVVIGDEELKDYYHKKNSAFFIINISLLDGRVSEIYLNLSMHDDNKSVSYARIILDYKCSYDSLMMKSGKGGITFSAKKAHDSQTNAGEFLLSYLYTDAVISNFKPGIMANYLKEIENYLNKQSLHECNAEIKNNEELHELKNEILYIVETKNSGSSCEKQNNLSKTELMAKYPYKYEFISYDELNEKLLKGETFYYAMCISKNPGMKNTSVFKSKSGECIFNNFIMQTKPYWKPHEFKQLAVQIEKK